MESHNALQWCWRYNNEYHYNDDVPQEKGILSAGQCPDVQDRTVALLRGRYRGLGFNVRLQVPLLGVDVARHSDFTGFNAILHQLQFSWGEWRGEAYVQRLKQTT